MWNWLVERSAYLRLKVPPPPLLDMKPHLLVQHILSTANLKTASELEFNCTNLPIPWRIISMLGLEVYWLEAMIEPSDNGRECIDPQWYPPMILPIEPRSV